MFKLEDGRGELFQWDLDRRVILDDKSVNEVHFCNRTDNCSLVTPVFEEGGKRMAEIPNILLQQDLPIKVYAYDRYYTKQAITYKVNTRTKPADYAYTETEVVTWQKVQDQVNQLCEAVYTAEEVRLLAESNRNTEEQVRQGNENARIDAELAREANYQSFVGDMEVALQEVGNINTSALDALKEAETVRAETEAALDTVNGAIAANDEAVAAAIQRTNAATEAAENVMEVAYLALSDAQMAQQAANQAIDAAGSANDAAENANAAATTANMARDDANRAATSADEAAARANEAAVGINNKFANALTGYATGEIVTLTDVSPIEHEIGVRVESKNLIPYPYVSTTGAKNGITWTINNDGSVSRVGTATALTTFVFTRDNTFLEDGVTYKVSAGLIVSYLDGTGANQYFSGGGANALTWKSSYQLTQVYSQVSSGKVVDDTIYPMIERGTVATEYTPYIGDLSAATVTKYSKNLFNPQLLLENGYSVQTDGTYQGTTTKQFVCFANPSGKKGAFAISVIAKNVVTGLSANALTFLVKYTDGTEKYTANLHRDSVGYQSVTGITDATKTVSEIIFSYGAKAEINIKQIQIEAGADATEYEAYVEPVAFTPAEGGLVEGVYSIYPTTTLVTDNAGAVISAEYNRDINKAFAELYNAIISMGVNV